MGCTAEDVVVAESEIVTWPGVAAVEMIGTVTVSVDAPAGNVTDSLTGAKIGLAAGVGPRSSIRARTEVDGHRLIQRSSRVPHCGHNCLGLRFRQSQGHRERTLLLVHILTRWGDEQRLPWRTPSSRSEARGSRAARPGFACDGVTCDADHRTSLSPFLSMPAAERLPSPLERRGRLRKIFRHQATRGHTLVNSHKSFPKNKL